MARILHVLPHPGGGGERQHRLVAERLAIHRHEFATLAARQTLPWALPGLLFRRPFIATRARHANLVHIDGDTAAILSAQVVGGRPYVITTNGLHLLRRTLGRQRDLVRRRLRDRILRSRATMCTSQAELEELGELCDGAAPLMLVRNGVPLPQRPSDEERAEARRALGLDDETVVAVALARLEPRKQPLQVARAAMRAQQQGAPITLLMAGDGPLRSELERHAGPGVRVLGFRDDPERLLTAADIFVLASEWEGLSLGLLEAMGAGLPAVVSDGPGNPEVVDKHSGLVVPVGDEEALAEALLEFAQSRERRLAAGAAARRRIEHEFSVDRMVEGVEAAYQRCLS